MTSELRANTAPFTQFDQNIVIKRYEVWKKKRHVLFARTVSVNELPFLVLPWAIGFAGSPVCPVLVLPWTILLLPWAIWFCHELYGFAVRCLVLSSTYLVLPRAVFDFAVSYFALPWTTCNCGDSYIYIYKQLVHKQFSLNWRCFSSNRYIYTFFLFSVCLCFFAIYSCFLVNDDDLLCFKM